MTAACATIPHRLIGQSAQIRQIRQLIPKLARSRSPVLLLGESGTGKEVVAQAIYEGNPAGNFVPIDCGSLVGPLMESELFGHVKGAFTGATENKRGLIELANGGTAFFDEIGDLPVDLQVKLLRVLQEREYRPVGSLARHHVDLRVIAATHRDLEKEVNAGRFRKDLFYRLNVISVRIPPLRDRAEDILPLVDHFLALLGVAHSLTHETRQALLNYDWPGNVRELFNCLQRMTAINSGPLLHTADLPSQLLNFAAARQEGRLSVAAAAGVVRIAAAPMRLEAPVNPANAGPSCPILPLAEVEKRAILDAIQYTKGDRTTAALLLGIGRTTLYRKLKEYQIDGE